MNVEGASLFVDSIRSNSSYYVFAGKPTPYTNNTDQVIPVPGDSVRNTTIDVYNSMIFGKRVQSSDVSLMIPRVDWQANTTFNAYNDLDTDLFNKPFYACVNTGTYMHVYKCLYNNGGTPSAVEPSGTDVYPFETPQDGYVWKYMYTASDDLMRKFATNDFVPVQVNNAVSTAAVEGSIDVVSVLSPGQGYNNYLVSEVGSSADLRVGGSPYLYALGSAASSTNGFYDGCIIKFTSGLAKDEYRMITDYSVNNGQKIITIDKPFNGVVVATDTYEIYPMVYVFDTGGSKQTNCIARAIVSPLTGNSIAKVEVLDAGSGYRSATATLLVGNVVNVISNANLSVVISPPGGHGSSAANELGARYAAVCVKFIENERSLPTENDFRSVGLLKDPTYANVNIRINTSDTVGSFTIGEQILQYSPVTLTGKVAIVAGNTHVVGTNTRFTDSIREDDVVIISDGSSNMLANVTSVDSDTAFTMNTKARFTNPACRVSLVRNASVLGVMAANSSGEIFVNKLNPKGLDSYYRLIGLDSYCTSTVDMTLPADQRISVNGRSITDNFETFVQLTKIVGTLTNGTFAEDEIAVQDSAVSYAQPSAYVHSCVDTTSNGQSDILYVTNVQNLFQPTTSPDSDGIITGMTSGAQFAVSTVYSGELTPDSGKVVFLENLNPVSRSNTQTETVRLVISF